VDGLELWGGVECTVNRVGDEYHSQLEFSGHGTRLSDLDLLADLGLRTLRYPLLWELTAPDGIGSADWRWGDERLGRLRDHGIRPILGLVHHGSGPRHTSLVDPSFATGLAEYAGAVAARYPWVDLYTPVNEPLTTARFSCLYGHWYPHRRDERSLLRALVNQCRATVLAMEAIRRVNPAACLVQTDDLGRVYSTPRVRYQADYENERRWLGWDLLCGTVVPGHAVWDQLLRNGVRRDDLEWFLDHPCPPDVVGINHYLTSDRFLHERPDLFPPHTRGGNGKDAYADVEAVRVLDPPTDGLAPLLREAWQRYGRPVAVTEAHLGCSREEQLRWLYEIWNIAREARRDGVDVHAVTVWALFGSYDWNSLLTRFTGHYEPGAFDLRGTEPRPTALAGLIQQLAAGHEPEFDPVFASPGWWHRPDRLLHALSEEPRACGAPAPQRSHEARLRRTRSGRPLLITGATGTLGRAFGRICEERGLPYRLLTRGAMDICCPDSVARVLDETRPWAVVNTAGYVRVDDAEHEPDRCYRENSDGPGVLARACADDGVRLLTFSSDLVFDGERSVPYVESDAVRPLNVYGLSKARAEASVLEHNPLALVVRTSAFFGPWDPHNFLTIALREMVAGREFVAADDAIVSPTYVPDLVNACLDLLVDGERGLWHLANSGKGVSWAQFAQAGARHANVGTGTLRVVSREAIGWAAARPAYSVLGSERAVLLPSLESALERYAGLVLAAA
jgi:dTDP-4-dehydrorhamnose reductase